MRAFFVVAIGSILCVFCVQGPSAVAQTNFLWIADMEEGSLADWYFPETSGIGDSGGGIFPSGKYSYFASIMEGRGTHSLAATIWTPSPIPNETSGVRAFRWKELRENRELYFSAWFLSSRPNQTHSVGRKFFHQTIKSVPFGNWVHFEVFLKQSNAFDGHVTFWQDGVKLFDFNNVKTSYFNSAFSSTTTAETQREDSKNARGNSRSIKNRFRR